MVQRRCGIEMVNSDVHVYLDEYHAHLEEGVEWMFVWSINIDLRRQFKVRLEAMTGSDIF